MNRKYACKDNISKGQSHRMTGSNFLVKTSLPKDMLLKSYKSYLMKERTKGHYLPHKSAKISLPSLRNVKSLGNLRSSIKRGGLKITNMNDVKNALIKAANDKQTMINTESASVLLAKRLNIEFRIKEPSLFLTHSSR